MLRNPRALSSPEEKGPRAPELVGARVGHGTSSKLNEEGIQDHLPVALPCYDFIQIEDPLLGAPLPKVKVTTSKLIDFPNVTGGVYKARERIHRCMADQRLLAIPTSCRRVAAYNPNLG